MAPTLAGLDFGVRSSYAARTSSAVSTHDDYPDLGLDTTMDVLSQLEMLSTPRSLHNLCRVDEHASLCTIWLLAPTLLFTASMVAIIDDL
jgi:hypothetical protein